MIRLRRLHKSDVELAGKAEHRQGRQQRDRQEAGVHVRRRGQLSKALGHPVRRSAQQQHHGEDRHRHQGRQLDHRLQCDGPDQAPIVFGEIGTARAEQDGETRQNSGHHRDCRPFRALHRRASGQQLPGHGQRFQLQGDVGDRAHDGDAGDQRAQALALAVSRRDEVGDGAHVLAPRRRRDAPPDRKQHHQADHRPDVDGQVLPAVTRRRADGAVIGP